MANELKAHAIRRRVCGLMLGALLIAAAGCAPRVSSGDANWEHPPVSEDDAYMRAFRAKHPQVEVLLAVREEDVTSNGIDDLVIIYRLDVDSNVMLVVHEMDGEVLFTNRVPAPIENQRVSFRDIDGEQPIELVLQGSKGAAVGFGIFRITDGVLENLFEEGMASCC